MIELLEKLNQKADNAATRILFLKKKVRELKKKVKLLILGKGKMEEDEKDEADEESEEEGKKKMDLKQIRKKLEKKKK